MKTQFAALFLFGLFTAGNALAAEKAKPSMKGFEISAEQRENMAAMHEKMAACLRSEKSMVDCQKEMMQSCRDTMGKNGCLMMGMGGMHGMMGNGMMAPTEKNRAENSPESEKPSK